MIRAVGRALAIFDAYDNEHLSLSLQEIAERIRMPKTTAFRLVNTLERAGFLVRMDNQQYCLSLKMARLGGLVRSTLSDPRDRASGDAAGQRANVGNDHAQHHRRRSTAWCWKWWTRRRR